MAYSNDILALSPSHYFKFDGNATDSIASLGSTDKSMVWTNNAIALDSTNCMSTNNVTDLLTLNYSGNINGELNRVLIAGWFMVTKINQPPVRIYGDGGQTASVSIHCGFGNQVLFEVDGNDFTLQIFGDNPLVPNRIYHLAIRFESSSYGNIFKGYIDGVNQTDTTDNIPGSPLTSSRSSGAFGGKNTGLALGGVPLKIVSPTNGYYNHWAFWKGVNATNVSDTEIRQELFEKGALASITLSSGTQSTMQSNVNSSINNSTYENKPLSIDIEAVTGDGDLTLTFTDVVFDKLTSLHVRYLGNGTLTIINSGTSNTSIVTDNITVVNPSILTITGLQNPTEVRVFEAGTTNEVTGQEDVTSGTFTNAINVSPVDIRFVSLDYKIFTFYNIDLSNSKTINIQQFYDRTYKNP